MAQTLPLRIPLSSRCPHPIDRNQRPLSKGGCELSGNDFPATRVWLKIKQAYRALINSADWHPMEAYELEKKQREENTEHIPALLRGSDCGHGLPPLYPSGSDTDYPTGRERGTRKKLENNPRKWRKQKKKMKTFLPIPAEHILTNAHPCPQVYCPRCVKNQRKGGLSLNLTSF